jgi:hypothetical protein
VIPIHDFAHVFKLLKNAQLFKCPEISDKENGITLFCVPTNFVEKWKDAIPFFNKSSHVCSHPFDESDIEKGKEILNVFYPFSRWQLKPGSYPKRMILDSVYPQELIRKRAGGNDQLAKKLVLK